MRKIGSVFAIMALLFIFVTQAHARTEFPTKEISGILKDVRFIPEGSPSFTVIEFDGGQVIALNNILAGIVFEKGKACVVKYKCTDAPFAGGCYLLSVEFKK